MIILTSINYCSVVLVILWKKPFHCNIPIEDILKSLGFSVKCLIYWTLHNPFSRCLNMDLIIAFKKNFKVRWPDLEFNLIWKRIEERNFSKHVVYSGLKFNIPGQSSRFFCLHTFLCLTSSPLCCSKLIEDFIKYLSSI